MKKILAVLFFLAGAAVVLFLISQLVPYGRNHTNPPVVQEPVWPNPETRELAVSACYDCHSNESTWPWYSNIAPVSWLVQRDVDEGRQVLNFSTWGQGEQELDEVGEVIQEGEMPPRIYLLTHPTARLSQAEKDTLIRGLLAMGGGMGDGEDNEDGEDDD